MQCVKCNEPNPAGTKFCRRCGEAMGGGGRSRGLFVSAGVVAAVIVGLLIFAFNTHVPVTPAPTTPATAGPLPITVGVAYGTEKRDWLNWAAAEFAKTPEAKNIQINLLPMGSLDAAHAIEKGDKSIQVWSPASSLYKNDFVHQWQDEHGNANPILSENPLALTPMVFVAWQQRFDAFAKHYNDMNFQTIGQAMEEKQGWSAIAAQSDWGFFKFSHTDPGTSNSGLMSLVLMSYDYRAKHAGLDNTDILDDKFQDWMRTIERNLIGARSGLSDSTGNLMTSMVQRGWSTYDVIFVYESVAIDYLDRANGRYGPLKVVYPKYNMWNDNPYYVLDVPWSSPEQRQAAKMFLDFLLTENVQREAMAHGFRPANTNVPTNGPDSPFTKYPTLGIRPDVPGVFCEPPRAEVMESLLLAWQRGQARLH